MQKTHHSGQNTLSQNSTVSPDINQAWISFFGEAMRLAELIGERRAANQAQSLEKENKDDDGPLGPELPVQNLPKTVNS
jgi:hypothetical protein